MANHESNLPQLPDKPYLVTGKIGQGAMGAVYEAYHRDNRDLRVAIKVIDSSHPDALSLFKKEMQTLAKLRHANVISISDQGTFQDGTVKRWYFVMPFLEGETLQQQIQRAGPIPIGELAKILRSVTAGLQAAHRANVIHRDIKPSNIFVERGGSVRVIDFGVAGFFNAEAYTGIKGTAPYMAPELLSPKKAYPPSALTDMFSLAVTTYEALTGKQPFVRSTVEKTLDALRKYIPPPAYESNPSVPLLVGKVIHKGMAKNPATRYESVEAFCDSFERALRGEALSEFDPALLKTRLRQVDEAFAASQWQTAHVLLKSIEEEGETGVALTTLRDKIDNARRETTINEALKVADHELEAKRPKEAWRTIEEAFGENSDDPRREKYREKVQKALLILKLEDARTQLEKREFAPARQSLNEALNIRRTDTQVSALLGRLRRMEMSEVRTANLKSQLFEKAKAARNRGHIEGALLLFSRLRELNKRLGARPIDDVYEEYYRGLLDERRSAESGYEKARQLLTAGDSDRLAELVRSFESTPDGFRFAALRLRTEQNRLQLRLMRSLDVYSTVLKPQGLRQQLAFLDGVARDDAPHLTEFRRNAEAQLDLVDSLVSKTETACREDMYGDAVRFLDVAADFDPSRTEIRAQKKTIGDQQKTFEEREDRGKLRDEIDWLVSLGDYTVAQQQAERACALFADDPDFQTLLESTRESVRAADRARKRLWEANDPSREKSLDERLALLEEAHTLDPNDPEIRHFLALALAERAEQLSVSNHPLAIEHCRKAHALAPEFTLITDLLKALGSAPSPDPDWDSLTDVGRKIPTTPLPASGDGLGETRVFTPPEPKPPPLKDPLTDQTLRKTPMWHQARDHAIKHYRTYAGVLGLVVIAFFLRTLFGWAKPDPPNLATISFATSPTGATILIEGRPPFTSPHRFTLAPGAYAIEASKTGFATKKLSTKVDQDPKDRELLINLEPLPAAVQVRHPPRSGWLDELGRLKGGRAMGLGVARCAP